MRQSRIADTCVRRAGTYNFITLLFYSPFSGPTTVLIHSIISFPSESGFSISHNLFFVRPRRTQVFI